MSTLLSSPLSNKYSHSQVTYTCRNSARILVRSLGYFCLLTNLTTPPSISILTGSRSPPPALTIGNAARQTFLVFPLFLVSFRGSAVESGIWIWLRACVCGKHFLCRNAAIGTEAERRRKGCKENRKESEKVVKGFYTRRTPGEIVMIVSAFC